MSASRIQLFELIPVTKFRQVTLAEADAVPVGQTVIETMDVRPLGVADSD